MRRSVYLIILLLSFLIIGPSWAEFIQPGDVTVMTEKYKPQINDFERGTYTYDISWEGVPVARSKVEVKDELLDGSGVYDVEAFCETLPAIDILYKMRHVSESMFSTDSFKPVAFSTLDKNRSKTKARQVIFSHDGHISAKRWKNQKIEEELSFVADNIFDPIAGTFMARSVPIVVGEEKSFDVFNGKHRFLITFKVEKRELIEVSGRQYDTFRVVPTVKKLTDSEGEKKLKSATIWITADERREIVKLESSVWIGSVTAELSGFFPADQSAIRPVVYRPERKEEILRP